MGATKLFSEPGNDRSPLYFAGAPCLACFWLTAALLILPGMSLHVPVPFSHLGGQWSPIWL
jgi:hypothetical protein